MPPYSFPGWPDWTTDLIAGQGLGGRADGAKTPTASTVHPISNTDDACRLVLDDRGLSHIVSHPASFRVELWAYPAELPLPAARSFNDVVAIPPPVPAGPSLDADGIRGRPNVAAPTRVADNVCWSAPLSCRSPWPAVLSLLRLQFAPPALRVPGLMDTLDQLLRAERGRAELD